MWRSADIARLWPVRRRPALVGIDIGATEVALVELERNGSGCRVRSFGIEPVAGAALAKNSNLDAPDEETSDPGAAIGVLGKRVRPGSRDAAVAVCGAVTRAIQMDASLTDEAMANRIAVDADGYLPYPVDEAAVDFEVGDLSPDNPEMVEVVFAACRRDEVERLRTALARGGFRASAVDVRELALARVMNRLGAAPDDAATALVELGSGGVAMTVFRGAGSLPAMVRDDSGAGTRVPCPALTTDDVRWEVQRLRELHAGAGGARIESALVAGELATDPDLAAAAREAMGVPAVTADPFSGMTLDPRVDREALAGRAPALLGACGLALRVLTR